MDARRFDIVPRGLGWWLSDSQTVGLPFVSEHAAIQEARNLARAHKGANAIYTWHHGEPIELYRMAPGRPEHQSLDQGPTPWTGP